MEVHFQLVREGRDARKDRLKLMTTYMRYVHSHSEPTSAPYFRILHALLQRISNDPILDDDEKIHYGNLVRGPFPSAEEVLLGVNSLLPISGDMKSFVTKFRMLKYLPNSSMRTILQQFHEPIAFTKRKDPPPPVVPSPGHMFADDDYRALVAAVHAERELQRLSPKELDRRLRRRGFVAAYEEGNRLLGILDLVDVSRALKRHPALFLRYP